MTLPLLSIQSSAVHLVFVTKQLATMTDQPQMQALSITHGVALTVLTAVTHAAHMQGCAGQLQAH